VHFRFPGVAREPGAAFDTLLTGSVMSSFAGRRASVPAIPAHAVLFALHQLRPEPGESIPKNRRDQVVCALQRAGEGTVQIALALHALAPIVNELRLALPAAELPSDIGPMARDWT